MNRRELKVYATSPWKLNDNTWESPATLMVESVACGSHGCLFWPADTIQAMAKSWHDVPLTIDHPTQDGTPVSVNLNQEIYSKYVIGRVINPWFDPVSKALKATIKLEPGRVGNVNQILSYKNLSIGVFSDEVQDFGQYRGKRYQGKVTMGTPDHVAVLPPGLSPACSWETGCGIRANMSPGEVILSQALTTYIKSIQGEIEMTTEKMLPLGVFNEGEETTISESELRALQEAEILLPTHMNINLDGHKPGQDDYQDEELLLPAGFV